MRTNREEFLIRIEIRLGAKVCEVRTGLDMRGFRFIEDLFQSEFLPEGYALERTSASILGFDDSMLKLMPGVTYAEKLSHVRSIVEQQQSAYDENGFVNRKKLVKGSASDYLEGKEIDVLVVPNELALKRTKNLLVDEIGKWIGLEFHFDSVNGEDNTYVSELRDLFSLWQHIDDNSPKSELVQREITAYEPELESVDTVDESLEQKFFRLLKEPISTYSEKERIRVFWAGGRPPVSRRKASSVASECFPKDVELPVREFISVVAKNLQDVWGRNSIFEEVGASSIDDLAVGQMIRSRGQLVVQAGKRLIKYEPTPASYVASQARITGGAK